MGFETVTVPVSRGGTIGVIVPGRTGLHRGSWRQGSELAPAGSSTVFTCFYRRSSLMTSP